ncbi:MAG: 3-hydroxyacyl-ACP dehydratase FabZ [Deltaproteobacteria bacterium]|nr:3-hydroxyacyl-ACP dehydratase FabZ [Deltaproteobacteria bacterium]
MTEEKEKNALDSIDILEIFKTLPHRYPFLLVDKILELEKMERARGLKNVTINEPFFQGHFPGHPIMPGVLIIEAMAQVAGILAFKSMGIEDGILYFTGIDKARFKRPVVPGDTLEFELTVKKTRGTVLWSLHGEAFVKDKLVASADIMASLVVNK